LGPAEELPKLIDRVPKDKQIIGTEEAPDVTGQVYGDETEVGVGEPPGGRETLLPDESTGKEARGEPATGGTTRAEIEGGIRKCVK